MVPDPNFFSRALLEVAGYLEMYVLLAASFSAFAVAHGQICSTHSSQICLLCGKIKTDVIAAQFEVEVAGVSIW